MVQAAPHTGQVFIPPDVTDGRIVKSEWMYYPFHFSLLTFHLLLLSQ